MNIKPIRANMTELHLGNGITVLFSYETPVAYTVFIEAQQGYQYYKTSTKWSKTTSRHISQWLNGIKAIEVSQETLDNLIK